MQGTVRSQPNTRVQLALMFTLAALMLVIGYFFGQTLKQKQANEERNLLNPIDIPFLQTMRVHHDQAITLSASLLNSSNPAIRQLAHDIYNTQLQESGLMRGLLMAWNAPQLPTGELWEWMTINADEQTAEFVSRCRAGGKMPGMADQEELNAVFSATGRARDGLFVQRMLEHHVAAMAMARHASEHAHSPLVKSLAASMQAAQRKELVTLGRLQSP